MKAGDQVIYQKRWPVSYDGKRWHERAEDIPVRILAIAGNWAMVRRPGCMPFCVMVKELKD